MTTFAIYESNGVGISKPELVAGGFVDIETAKDAFVEHMDTIGLNILFLEKDDEHEAYDALVGNGCTYMIEEIKSSYM